jgi:hypothetical protein
MEPIPIFALLPTVGAELRLCWGRGLYVISEVQGVQSPVAREFEQLEYQNVVPG